MGRRAEASDGADLDGAARPEASADAWQATQDRRLGQGEKSLLDLPPQVVTAGQHGGELGSQFGHQAGGSLRTADRDHLGQGRLLQLLGERLGSPHALRFQHRGELVSASLPDGRPARVLLQDKQDAAAVEPLAEGALKRWPMRQQQRTQAIGQPIGVARRSAS
jgi:hypothetical protein